MNKENNKSKLNDPEYFKDLQKKMMQHADVNPHQSTNQWSLYSKWIAAAAVIVFGVLLYTYMTNDTSIKRAIANNNIEVIDSPLIKDNPMSKNDAASKDKSSRLAPQEVKMIQAIKMEELEEYGPMDEEESEDELLEDITEDELDELLAEYT